jgi:hypothetical protein
MYVTFAYASPVPLPSLFVGSCLTPQRSFEYQADSQIEGSILFHGTVRETAPW